MALNVTTAVIGSGCNTATATPSLAQWDVGQVLKIEGVDLPSAYQVEFSTEYTRNAIPQIGNADGVAIPNELLQRSAPITAYIVLHEGLNDREREYWITIYITPGTPPETITPDPEQMDVIDETIAALQAGVAAAEAAAESVQNMVVEAETLAAGSEASVEKTVDPETGEVTLTFGIPRGDQGNPGTTPDFQIGTVETLPATSPATATITGTPAEPVLNLGIPQGPKGDPGGSSGTTDYRELENKPQINGHTLSGDQSASDLGLGTYSKPGTGIPKTDLASDVQQSLGKADSALQSAPVSSVAGKTGAVQLNAGDIEFDDSETYAAGSIGAEVSQQKNAISQLATKKYVADATGNANLTGGFDYGFIWLYTSTIDVTAVQTSSTVKYIVVECSAGDQFTLMGTEPSGSTGRLYAFVAADGTRLSYLDGSLSKYTVITAPTNTAYLVVDVVADAPYGLYSGALINITVASVDDVVENVQNRFVLSTSVPGYISITGTISNQDSIKKERTSDFIPITSNSFAIQLWGNITDWWCTVGFYDVNKQWIDRYGQTNPTNKNGRLIKTVTVPSNIGAAYYRVSTRFYADGKLMITDSPSDVLPAFQYAIEDYLLMGNIDSVLAAKNMLATGLRNPLLMPPQPRCMLHRGAATLAPENTMPAFEIAAESGVWGIETDVYETTDGYFVLSHDDDVSRMTDGTGKITEMTYAQTQECTIDAGANIDQYPGLKMPTLDAYLKLCRDNGCVACVEIKGITHYDSFVNAIRSAGMEGSCIILIYYNATKINTLRNLTPIPINLIYSTGLNINTAVSEAKSFSDLWIDLYSTTVTAEVVKTAHANNIPVNTWTYNNKTDAQNGFINYGLDLITVAAYAD